MKLFIYTGLALLLSYPLRILYLFGFQLDTFVLFMLLVSVLVVFLVHDLACLRVNKADSTHETN